MKIYWAEDHMLAARKLKGRPHYSANSCLQLKQQDLATLLKDTQFKARALLFWVTQAPEKHGSWTSLSSSTWRNLFLSLWFSQWFSIITHKLTMSIDPWNNPWRKKERAYSVQCMVKRLSTISMIWLWVDKRFIRINLLSMSLFVSIWITSSGLTWDPWTRRLSKA